MTKKVTVPNELDFEDVTDASVKAGGSDTVGTVGAPSGGVAHGTFAATDGPTLRALVSTVTCTRLVVRDHTSVLYALKEFVVYSTSENTGKEVTTYVDTRSGEGIGVAVPPLTSDSVVVAHYLTSIPDDTYAE